MSKTINPIQAFAVQLQLPGSPWCYLTARGTTSLDVSDAKQYADHADAQAKVNGRDPTASYALRVIGVPEMFVSAELKATIAARVKIKVSLGDATRCAAQLDSSPQGDALKRCEKGKGWIRGTRTDLLELLYYIESCPANYGDGADPIERSAVRRTIKAWRSKLDLGMHDEIPVPESASR